MLQYALYTYVPQRFRRISFEQQETNRYILDFKNGRTYAKQWAAEAIGRALVGVELQEVVVVCVPASCQRTYAQRYRKFSRMLCDICGAADGFDCIEVIGHRQKAHRRAHRDASLVQNVVISSSLRGRKVLVIDDIYTTGTSSSAFISELTEAGAHVCGAVFLGKTRKHRTA